MASCLCSKRRFEPLVVCLLKSVPLPPDFVVVPGAQGAYMLVSRDLVTNDIEVAVEGALLDGMVCLTSCDKTVPGQLMAAGRLNIPTLMVAFGLGRGWRHDQHRPGRTALRLARGRGGAH